MAEEICSIIKICNETKNKHLMWFGRLLDKHFEGVIAHATYRISSGKNEGINRKIKTIRSHGYGYPDDEYFFLKVIAQVERSSLEIRDRIKLMIERF